MKPKPQSSPFQKIMQEGKSQLEATIIEQSLQLRLTISESSDIFSIYVGQIKSLTEHQKLQAICETMEQVLEFIRDPKNIRLNLNDISVTLVTNPFGNKILQLIKVTLNKLEQDINESFSLQDIIDRCNEKNEIDNDEIKSHLEILARQIVQLKLDKARYKFQSLKESILGQSKSQVIKAYGDFEQRYFAGINQLKKENEAINEKSLAHLNECLQMIETNNAEIKKKVQKTQQEYQSQIALLKDNVQAMSVRVSTQQNNFIKFQKMVEEKNILSIENVLKGKIEFLSQGVEKLDKRLSEKDKEIEDMKRKILKQSQNMQVILGKMLYLDVYIQKEKENILKMNKLKTLPKLESQKWFNEFTFDGKTLVKITDTYWRQFVFFEPITIGKQFRFEVKIVKSRQRNMMIGIVDYEKQKQKNSSYNSKNAICYGIYSGRKYPEAEKEGDGVDVGETVEVRVDRANKKITWMVNGVYKACCIKEMLGDEERQLFGYVQMFEDGDQIQINFK